MSYNSEIDLTILDNKKKRLEVVLDTIISRITSNDLLINSIATYVMFPGGKRLRALLTVLMYEMLGGVKGDIYACASTTEMIHAATLMLDDLPCMDNSDYRRGKESSHKKFGDAQTILVAFGLAAESFRVLSDKKNAEGIESDQLLFMMQEISLRIGFNGLIGGQVADLNAGKTLRSLSEETQRISYIMRNKTAVLFEVCALVACCLAQAHNEDKQRMITYAYNIGLALQIFDDIHDRDEDKGLSFLKIYGFDKTKQLLYEAIEKAQACIIYENASATILRQLPYILWEKV